MSIEDTVFTNNINSLKEYHPHFYNTLTNYLKSYSCTHKIEYVQKRDLSLSVDNIQITSAYCKDKQAQFNISKIDLTKPIDIYGVGLFDEVRLILNTNINAKINIHLLNPNYFYTLLSLDDSLYEIFRLANVHFILQPNVDTIALNSVIIVSELYIFEEQFIELKNLLKTIVDEDYVHQKFVTFEQFFKDNIIANETLLKDIPIFTKLEEYKNILVIGAGPSVDKNIKLIKQFLSQKDSTIIAVDTALCSLERHNIIAPYIISVDHFVYNYVAKSFFKDMSLYKNSTLIFNIDAHAKLYESFPGRKFYYYNKNRANILSFLDPKKSNIIFDQGSVVIAACSLATIMGAKNIFLLGCDFAYFNDQSHSSAPTGMFNPQTGALEQVLCNDNTYRQTQRNFLNYKFTLESFIKNKANTKFYNLSLYGSKIKNCPYIQEDKMWQIIN